MSADILNSPLYGLDIETDTETDGLDPAMSEIVSIALATTARSPFPRFLPTGSLREWSHSGGGHEVAVFDRFFMSEAAMLRAAALVLAQMRLGTLVTWNGAAFDLPFIADRAAICGVDIGLRLMPAPDLECKYGPLSGHVGAYRATWLGHGHVDVCGAGREMAAERDVEWSLKPVASAYGFAPVVEERAALHEVTAERRIAYVASDAAVTLALGEMLADAEDATD